MKHNRTMNRRTIIKGTGALGAISLAVSTDAEKSAGTTRLHALSPRSAGIYEEIYQKVQATPFIDTHEHLMEERDRIKGIPHSRIKSDDWTLLFDGYLSAEMISAGMPYDINRKFFSPDIDPLDKWIYLEPYWHAIKNTGYGQTTRIAIKELYGIDQVSSRTIKSIQDGYERIRKPGFYKYILRDCANIESCHVDCRTGKPFEESGMPTLLMQDIYVTGMFSGTDVDMYLKPTGMKVNSLYDWHKVIDWWFDKYGKYAVAAKSTNAYGRNIDYDDIPAKDVEVIFTKKMNHYSLTESEQKALEDHLFWYIARKATGSGLPVKIHTGYYTGTNGMPLSRVSRNAASAADICRISPTTRFIFMHICYPYYEDLLAVAKHYTNAYVDMCWSWIINPIAAKDFLKKYIMTAPLNKLLTFGGDYVHVEPVLGHAIIARHGIVQALTELVEEDWLSLDDALELTDPIMHGNARKIFNLREKEELLKQAPWAGKAAD